MYAKSVECKSVTAATRGDVLTQIRKAIEQLAGNTGHMPRPGDVRIIDVQINSRDNPWPGSGGHYTVDRGIVAENDLLRMALDDFKMLLGENKDGANKLRAWIVGDPIGGAHAHQPLRSFPQSTGPITPPVVHAGSTRPVVVEPTGPASVKLHKVRCVALKVRFDPPYITRATMTEGEEVSEISMQAFRAPGGTVDHKVVKVKKNVFTDHFLSGGYTSSSLREFK